MRIGTGKSAGSSSLRHRLAVCALGLGMAAGAVSARAQALADTYPSRPVAIIIPVTP